MVTKNWAVYGDGVLEGGKYGLDGLLEIAESAVDRNTRGSKLLVTSRSGTRMPVFKHSELRLGQFLGKGGFAVVHDIAHVKLLMSSEDDDDDSSPSYLPGKAKSQYGGVSLTADIAQDRDFMALNYRRGQKSTCRYALKRVQNFKNAHDFVNGVVDLAVEAKFLAVLRHPNIIKLRGTASTSPFDIEFPFFLVLDRLNEILSDRLKKWKARKNSLRSRLNCFGRPLNEFWVQRLAVALGIAKALNYIHGKDVVYRDIKPDNIGFDVRGDVKLFDFGLAKEMSPSKKSHSGLYNLTADTGSPRYMAPEVALSKPYNELVDVYSFSILLWEMMETETPFKKFHTMSKFHQQVVKGGARPVCDPSWPFSIQNLLKRSWSAKISDRPTMGSVVSCLKSETLDCHMPRGCPDDSYDECSSIKSNLSRCRLLQLRERKRVKSLLF